MGPWPSRRAAPPRTSGGQHQRVAVARALVKKPTVLLADEPTGNLDEGTRDEIIELLEKLWKDLGLTLILVTHDSSVARRAQRVGQMRDGRLLIKQDTRGAHQAAVPAGQAGPGSQSSQPRA
jgi:putative ABC transport system ATP-binding protein